VSKDVKVMLRYPRKDHDDWLSRKLSCDDVEQVKKDFRKGKLINHIALDHGVAWTTIKRWVDPIWRTKDDKRRYLLKVERLKTDNAYKKHDHFLSNKRSMKRRNEDPLFMEWIKKSRLEYMVNRGGAIKTKQQKSRHYNDMMRDPYKREQHNAVNLAWYHKNKLRNKC